jgi:hypothetical protein
MLLETSNYSSTPRGAIVTGRLRAMGIRDKPIAPASPWQNGFAERLIGSIRRECVDHFIVLGEAHLRHILRTYARYYNHIRTHWSLDKDTPLYRPAQRIGSINSHAILGGLHHHYVFRFSAHTRWRNTKDYKVAVRDLYLSTVGCVHYAGEKMAHHMEYPGVANAFNRLRSTIRSRKHLAGTEYLRPFSEYLVRNEMTMSPSAE